MISPPPAGINHFHLRWTGRVWVGSITGLGHGEGVHVGAEARILAVGEVLWDCFGREQRLGGAPFNFGYHAATQGAESAVVTAIGADDLGRAILDAVRANGRFRLVSRPGWPGAAGRCAVFAPRDPAHPTGIVRVTVDRAGNPTFRILARRAWDHIAWRPALARLARQADLVCFGTLAQRSPVSRETIRRVVEATHGVRLCDLNLRAPFFNEATVRRSLGWADVVKLNEEEFAAVRRMFGLPTGRLAAARRLMRDFAIDLICVTRGARGCWLAGPRTTAAAPGERVEVVDTVGAGDAFAASLAVDLLAGRRLGAMARRANRAAARVAAHAGAIGPD